MAICGWVEVLSSGDSKFGIGECASGIGGSKFSIWKGASGREHLEGSIGKGVSGSGSSNIDIGMRAAQQAVGCWQ